MNESSSTPLTREKLNILTLSYCHRLHALSLSLSPDPRCQCNNLCLGVATWSSSRRSACASLRDLIRVCLCCSSDAATQGLRLVLRCANSQRVRGKDKRTHTHTYTRTHTRSPGYQTVHVSKEMRCANFSLIDLNEKSARHPDYCSFGIMFCLILSVHDREHEVGSRVTCISNRRERERERERERTEAVVPRTGLPVQEFHLLSSFPSDDLMLDRCTALVQSSTSRILLSLSLSLSLAPDFRSAHVLPHVSLCTCLPIYSV